MKTAILTDTHSGITRLQAEEKGIYLLEAPVIINGKEYKEGLDLNYDMFFKAQAEGADIKTSQSSVGDILFMWDSLLKDYDEIVVIPLTSGLTGAFNTMSALASEEPYAGKVFPVDNTVVSVLQKNSVYEARALADKGYSGADIKRLLEENRPYSIIYITVTELEHLKRGGRITPAAAALGTLLRIKPILEIDGGKLDAYAKARTMASARALMVTGVKQELIERFHDPEAENCYIMVAHTKNDEMADEYLSELKTIWPKATFAYDPLPLAIACHTGPGALGIAAQRKIKEAW